MKVKCLIILVCLIALYLPIVAQSEDVVVPDLTGLNVPQAAAELNRTGLALGQQISEGWTEASGLSQNVIGGQSVDSGMAVPRGTAIDITVFRTPNVILIYDDNDLTFINQTGASLDLTGFQFQADTGESFNASQWRGGIDSGDCGQIWSISRGNPKSLPECDSIFWVVLPNRPETHFWTQLTGVSQFGVIQDGVVRQTCVAAPANSQDAPLRCEFFVSSDAVADDTIDFLYFSYTTEALALINRSDSQWMPTNQSTILNNNPALSIPGVLVRFDDPTILPPESLVGFGDTAQLAPQQCLLLRVAGADTPSPEDCDVVAQNNLSSELAFWLADFQIQSSSINSQHTCPAATEGRLTICIMPR